MLRSLCMNWGRAMCDITRKKVFTKNPSILLLRSDFQSPEQHEINIYCLNHPLYSFVITAPNDSRLILSDRSHPFLSNQFLTLYWSNFWAMLTCSRFSEFKTRMTFACL
jgi:hypothetical protein